MQEGQKKKFKLLLLRKKELGHMTDEMLTEGGKQHHRINRHHLYTDWITDTLKLNLPLEASYSEGLPMLSIWLKPRYQWGFRVVWCSRKFNLPTKGHSSALNHGNIASCCPVEGTKPLSSQDQFQWGGQNSCTTGTMMGYRNEWSKIESHSRHFHAC